MSPTFKKIKSYYLIKAIVTAIALGLALAFFAVGGTLLVLKLLSVNLDFWWYVLIGVGAFLPAAAITFLVTKKSDDSIAKMLDSVYTLDERVQTMLENKDSEGIFIMLQRQDTEIELSNIETDVYKLKKNAWVIIGSFVLALVLFIVSLCIPFVKQINPDPEVFEIKEWQTIALDSLIGYVDASTMDDEPREEIATDLVSLREALYRIEDEKIITLVDESVLIVNVNASITTADNAVENYNSYKKLYNSIRNSEDDNVKNFARGMSDLDMTERMDYIKSAFVGSEEQYEQLKLEIVGFADFIRAAFSVSEISQNDAFRVATSKFLSDLSAAAVKVGGTYSQLQDELTSIFAQHTNSLNEVLAQQKNNRTIANYVINELISIFDIKNPPPTGGETLVGIEGQEKEEEIDTPGGPPDPDMPKYGSDDLIYDPNKEQQIEYGEILIEQASKKDGTVKEEQTPPELEDIIDDYFSALAGTMPMPDDENNNENQ